MKKLISLALVVGLCLILTTPVTMQAKEVKEAKEALDIIPVTLDSAGSRTAAITSDNTLWMWGSFVRPTPWQRGCEASPVKIMEGVASVCCGGLSTAVIKKDKSLWMWGMNTYGELGNGKAGDEEYNGNRYSLSPIKIMDDVVAVSIGGDHTAVIKTDGSLWLFGCNDDGEIGNDYTSNVVTETGRLFQTVPVRIMEDVVYVSCGPAHTAAIKKDGSLWTWGCNSVGQLGNGKKGFSNDQGVPVKVLDEVASVSCGGGFTVAIKKDGSLWTWGSNTYGMLGVGSTSVEDSSDIPIKIMDNVLSVDCGCQITAVIKTDGSLWLWGYNGYGVVGPKDSECIGTPTKVMDGCRLVTLGGEGATIFVAKSDESLYGWGRKMYLGIGVGGNDGYEDQPTPVKVPSNVVLPDIPSAVGKEEVNAAIEAKLVPKALRKDYQKFITCENLAKILTQLAKQSGGEEVDMSEILATSEGTFNPKGKVTESRFITAIKRLAKALGVKYKSFGLKRSKTKMTTERAIVMTYRAFGKMFKKRS